MAYLVNDDKEEGIEGAGGLIAPSSGIVAPGAQGSDAPEQADNFATLQSYMKANEGNAQGLAQGVGDQITNKADEAYQSGKQAYQGLVDEVGQGAPSFTANDFQLDTPTNYSNRGNLKSQIDSQGSQLQQAFQEQWTPLGGDKISQALQDSRGLKQESDDLSALSKKETGRFDLLKKAFTPQGGQAYTRGETGLDQALLQNDPQAKNILSQARTTAESFPTFENEEAALETANVNKGKEFDANKLAIQKKAQDSITDYLNMLGVTGTGLTSKINNIPTGNFGGIEDGAPPLMGSYYNYAAPLSKLSGGNLADQKVLDDLQSLEGISGTKANVEGSYISPYDLSRTLNADNYESLYDRQLKNLSGLYHPSNELDYIFNTIGRQPYMPDLQRTTGVDKSIYDKIDQDLQTRLMYGIPLYENPLYSQNNFLDNPNAQGGPYQGYNYNFNNETEYQDFAKKLLAAQNSMNNPNIADIFNTSTVNLNPLRDIQTVVESQQFPGSYSKGPAFNQNSTYDDLLNYFNSMDSNYSGGFGL